MRLIQASFSLLWLVFLAACSAAPSGLPSATITLRSGELTPFWTPTPTLTSTPRPTATSTPTPTATPTPLTHTVALNETLTSIALKYGISLQALRAANPDVVPELLRVGDVLIIPTASGSETPTAPVPTPLPLEVSNPICYPDLEGGAWCFCQVHNTFDTMVESVSLRFEIIQQQADGTIWQQAQEVAAPLNFWQAGDWIPLAAYFESPLPVGYHAAVELLTALPAPEGDSRCLPVILLDQQVELADNGKSVEVSGEIQLAADAQPAGDVWVLAAAYDQNGSLIGLRRWESGVQLLPGESLPYSVRIYAIGAPAIRAEVWAQALP